jgi:hypothetical protein
MGGARYRSAGERCGRCGHCSSAVTKGQSKAPVNEPTA